MDYRRIEYIFRHVRCFVFRRHPLQLLIGSSMTTRTGHSRKLTNPLTAELFQTIARVYPGAVRLRRWLHTNPELSNHEHNTARHIAEHLRAIGLRPRFFIGRTGIAASLINGPGKTVVLRADTDALPITELTTVAWRSQKSNVMHACGHDMHTAICAGAADVLSRMRQLWQGTVVFLFQPAEEVEPGGAIQMIAEGAFPSHADAVFGMHVSVDHPVGQIGIKPQHECAAVSIFDVTVHGRGGHGALPKGITDPLVCAAAMVAEVTAIGKYAAAEAEPALITIGSLHAGSKHNIIPDQATFGGTLRSFSVSNRERLVNLVQQKLKNIAIAHKVRVTVTFKHSFPAGYNDPALAAAGIQALRATLGSKAVILRPHPVMFSDDFVYYQQRCPGLYMHLGVRPIGARSAPGIHCADFCPDEGAIATGMAAFATLAMNSLRQIPADS
jgi:amidohydrolase